jgi:hypothetical protein
MLLMLIPFSARQLLMLIFLLAKTWVVRVHKWQMDSKYILGKLMVDQITAYLNVNMIKLLHQVEQ